MTGSSEPEPQHRVAVVVVDYKSGEVLANCIRSFLTEGCTKLCVVDNAGPGSATAALGELVSHVAVIETGANLGYGAGVNRGVAAIGDGAEFIVVANPDIDVHPGAITALCEALATHPKWAIAAPVIFTPEGETYPSVRRFPGSLDAAGHALLGQVWPANPFTRRYLTSTVTDPSWGVDWVSGACFVIRTSVFLELGGFDESYFMFAEDLDLCFRVHQAGHGIALVEKASVTHIEGVSRRSEPYKMLAAHHRSALRFQMKSAEGWQILLLPFAAGVLGCRFVLAVGLERRRRARGRLSQVA